MIRRFNAHGRLSAATHHVGIACASGQGRGTLHARVESHASASMENACKAAP